MDYSHNDPFVSNSTGHPKLPTDILLTSPSPSFPSSFSFRTFFSIVTRANVCECHKFVQIEQQQLLCPQEGQRTEAKVDLFEPATLRHTSH